VAGWILNSRAESAAVLWPFETIHCRTRPPRTKYPSNPAILDLQRRARRSNRQTEQRARSLHPSISKAEHRRRPRKRQPDGDP
jgi:hypothetical protein